ncbi:MAG: protein kinase domain-containing protein, partial [Bradymonadia bacterium]
KGAQLGTIWYMPPEQLAAQKSSPSWDVFALGVTLAELWTGKLPLVERTQSAVFRRHLDGDPIPPWSVAHKTACPELCDLLEAALEINPEKRLKSLSVFHFLIASLSKHYGLSLSPLGTLPRVSENEMKQSLVALSEQSIQRLCSIADSFGGTQEITISVDRQLVSSGSVVTDLDDTLLTNSVNDENE